MSDTRTWTPTGSTSTAWIGRYGDPEVVGRREKVRSTAMDGLILDVDDVLGPPAGP
ncbi:MAG: hypothetical protein ACRDYA_15095 [Egibacteraceae bacterium]